MKSIIELENNLSKIITKPVLICCSGGPDSVFLTHIISKVSSLNHHVVYFNHQLRPNEIPSEIQLIKSLCEKLNYTHHIEDLIINKKTQASFRQKRLERMAILCNKINVTEALLGHHLNDDIETLVMQLFRGATTNFRGIPKISTVNEINIIHPMLTIPKKDILNYLNKHKIPFLIDSSNKSKDYKRNETREILEKFYTTFEFSHHQIKNTLEMLKKSESKYIETANKINIKEILNGYWVKKNDINQLTDKEYILKIICERKFNQTINSDDLKKIVQGLNKTSLTEIQLQSITMQMDYKWILIVHNIKSFKSNRIYLNQILKTPIGDFCVTELNHELESNHKRYCTSKESLPDLKISTLSNCTMKIPSQKKKLRTHEISPLEQLIYPVIFNEKEIIWIPNVYHKKESGNVIITFQKNQHPLGY